MLDAYSNLSRLLYATQWNYADVEVIIIELLHIC